jgi:elongation factor P hydroxylase
LIGGAAEPIYLPAGEKRELSEIHFRHDYSASALHEVAHWCVAGPERRTQVDFGYWYAPDGRTHEQQNVFEQVEVKPQALEWIFSRAAGMSFKVSADNLAQGIGASSAFKQAITAQARHYCDNGLPARAAQWVGALAAYFQSPNPLDRQIYQLDYLGD